MLLTENDSKGIVEADSERVKPLDYEAMRKKAGGQKPLCPYVVELEELRQDPYKAPSYRVFETAYHTDNMVAVSADGCKLEKKRHGKVYVLHSDAQMAQFKDIVADYQMCLQELGEAIAAYPRCSKAIPEGTEYVVQVPIVGQKLPTWMAPYIERFRLLGGNATLKVEPLAEEFDEEGNKKDQSQRIGKDAAIVVSDEEWEELSELYDQCVYESQRLEKFLAEAGSYEDLVCSTYADTSEIQAQINSLKAKIKQTKSNLKAVNGAKSTASFNEQLRKLEGELEKLKGDLEVVENGNFYLVTLEQEKAPDPNNFSWIICADQANPEAISKANIEQLEYILKCLQKPFHPFADKGRVSAVKAELAKKKECNNSTSVQGSALALPSPDSNSDSNLSDSLKLTSTVEESSASDIPESQITTTSKRSLGTGMDSGLTADPTLSRPVPLAPPSPSEEDDSEPATSETVSPQLSAQSDASNLDFSSSKTSPDYLAVLSSPDSPQAATLKFSGKPSPKSGTTSNGQLSVAPTLEAPGVEKDSLLLASPTALSSNGNGNPPGQSKLEDQLRKMGAIGPKEVANPEFLEAGSGIPLGWTNPQDERSALEFLQEMELSAVAEKPLVTRSIRGWLCWDWFVFCTLTTLWKNEFSLLLAREGEDSEDAQVQLWNVDPEVLKIGELSYFESEAVEVEVVEPDFYDDLDTDDAENLRFDASEIRSGMNSLWETTVKLAEISERAQERCREIDKKKELPRGTTYNAWVAYEFQGEGQKLAYAKQELERHRRVKKAFDTVPSEVMNLIVPSARLLLASDNYENARDIAISLARCGTEITVKLARDLIADSPTSHKPKKQAQPALPPERFSGEVTLNAGRTYTQEELEREVEERLPLAIKEYLMNSENQAWLKETLQVEVDEQVAEEAEAKVSIQQELQQLKAKIGQLERENSNLYTQNLRLKQSELAEKVAQLEAEKDQLHKQLLAKREEAFKGGEFTNAAVRAIGKAFKGQEEATIENFRQQYEEVEIENRRLQLENEQLKAKLEALSKSASVAVNSPQLELVTNASTAEVNSEQMPIGA